MNQPQPTDNANPSPLEDRLRSMILGNVNSNVDPKNSSAGRPPAPPTQPGGSPAFHHHHPQHQRQQPQDQIPAPHHGRQQQNNRYARHSRGPRGNAHGDFASRGPHTPGDPQSPRSQHSPQRMANRGFPSHHVPQLRNQFPTQAQSDAQWQFLEQMALQLRPELEMAPAEMADKDRFRAHLEEALQHVLRLKYPDTASKATLACFGSVASGFGMPGSDMDLALVSTVPMDDVFRPLEKHLLNIGHGAHLLTKTRVPILKICESPSPELLSALREERQKWDDMTPEQRERHDHPARFEAAPAVEAQSGVVETRDNNKSKIQPSSDPAIVDNSKVETTTSLSSDVAPVNAAVEPLASNQATVKTPLVANGNETAPQILNNDEDSILDLNKQEIQEQPNKDGTGEKGKKERGDTATPRTPRSKRPWFREKRLGPLDFPKDGVGVQCDINFANPLGLHNTALLRCYSHCDARVRLMVLFVKAWASKRKINSARNGTLSSYGYVLMVLHFLVNVAKPPVCPNLQLTRKPQNQSHPVDPSGLCDGWDVRFWRNEAEIKTLSAKGMLSHNHEPLGMLLRDFFRYYAQQGYHGNGTHGFAWMQSVLSLRTPGGLISKEAKGWTGAKTTVQDNVEVRHRYLFAIEDPFELDHNVARPVTHNGIVAIRDEFRRAWNIITLVGRGMPVEGGLLDLVISQQPAPEEEDAKSSETAQEAGGVEPASSAPVDQGPQQLATA